MSTDDCCPVVQTCQEYGLINNQFYVGGRLSTEKIFFSLKQMNNHAI